MIATRIGSIRIVVCASPSYLKEHGRPKQLDDLSKHHCITIDEHAAPRRPGDSYAVAGRRLRPSLRGCASIRPKRRSLQRLTAPV